MQDNRVGAVKLIRDYFAPITMEQMKALTSEDRAQLGSAIAREQGLKQEQVSFEMVEY